MSDQSLVAEGEDSLLGLQVGNWLLKRKLGEGGMAVVYLGIHQFLPKIGAVKVLRREFARNENVIERFRREALAADSLNHPNIIHVEDFGRDPRHDFFMVLEYLTGRDLESFCNEAPFAKSWVLGIMRQVCAGLEKTHEAGIVHRDLKPSNIFLMSGQTRIPRIKILDFGIAKAEQQFDKKLTRTGSIVGTPAYLAPEQLKPKQYEIKQTVDIYALGVILYQLLTGRLPIERDSFFEYLMATFTEVPRTIGVLRPELAGTELEALVARLLEKKPEDRPQSMSEVWTLLEKAAASFDDPLDKASKYPSPGRYRVEPVTYDLLKQEVVVPTSGAIQVSSGQGTFAYPGQGGGQEPLPSGAVAVPSGAIPVRTDDQFDTYVEDLPSSTGFSRQSLVLIIMALVMMLGVGGWWVTRKPTTSVVKVQPRRDVGRRPPPRRKDSVAFLDDLFQKGVQAIKNQQLSAAVTNWKKMTKVKGWKKSRYFPSLYAGIGDSLAKQKRAYSAKVYYKQYLKATKQLVKQKAKAKDSKAFARVIKKAQDKAQVIQSTVLPSLNASIAKKVKESKTMLRAVQKQLRRKSWKRAYKAYETFAKKSVDSPQLQLQMVEALKIRFPLKTLSLLKKIEKELELSKQEKERLKQQREFVLAMLKKQKAELKGLLETIQEHLQKRQFRKSRRKIKGAVRKYALLALAAPEFLDLINETLPNDIKEGIWIAEFYKKTRKKSRSRGLLLWMAKDAGKILTEEEIEQRLAELRRLLKVQRLLRRLQKSLQRGNVDSASRLHKQLQKRLGKDNTRDDYGYRKRAFRGLRNLDGWRPVYRQLFSIHRLMDKYSKAVNQTAFQTHQAQFLEKLEMHRKKFPQLLTDKVINGWKRAMKRMERKIRIANGLRRRASNYYNLAKRQGAKDSSGRKAFRQAVEQFQSYLKYAPNAADRGKVRYFIRKAKCAATGVSHKSCP